MVLPTVSLAESPNGSSDFRVAVWFSVLPFLNLAGFFFWFFFGVTPTVIWLTGIRELPRFSFLFFFDLVLQEACVHSNLSGHGERVQADG